MESALGPSSICMFPYGITPFQMYSYINLTKFVSIIFLWNQASIWKHFKSIWKHLESSGYIVWMSQRSLRSVPLSSILHCWFVPIVLVFAMEE